MIIRCMLVSRKRSVMRAWSPPVKNTAVAAEIASTNLLSFASAGVELGDGLGQLARPLPLAILAGLFIGKQIGIFGASWLMIRFGFARLPEGANWLALYAVAVLCGIGFTMSLFIGALAFDDSTHAAALRIGVLAGSLISAIVGVAAMHAALARRPGEN